jgi:hypothetical protein
LRGLQVIAKQFCCVELAGGDRLGAQQRHQWIRASRTPHGVIRPNWIRSILDFDVRLAQSLATPPATRRAKPQAGAVVSTVLHAIIAPDALCARNPGELVGRTRGTDSRNEDRGWFALVEVSWLVVG